MNPPLVSVVIATYNASHLLRYAIASVLGSDYPHFEIIVVGDHCTDDTEMVVASFADERIHFINLERNSGQQATPNNAGVAAARGEFLCFLNQDDMYLPHHLSSNVATIRGTGADIVCSAYPAILPATHYPAPGDQIAAVGAGFEPTGRFSPRSFHVASSWFLRRNAAARVGPWRHEGQAWVTPSQDWLFRAWRKRLRIHCTRAMSIVVLHQGWRRGSYGNRATSEHERVFQQVVRTDRSRDRVFQDAASWFEATLHPTDALREPYGWFDAIVMGKQWSRANKPRKLKIRYYAGRERVFEWAQIVLGLHPNTLAIILDRGWRRGELIREQQRFIGLKPVTK